MKNLAVFLIGLFVWYFIWVFSAWEFPLQVQTWSPTTRAFFLIEGILVGGLLVSAYQGYKNL